MSNIYQVIFFSLIGGIFSLIGGAFLLAKKSWLKPLARYATPFAAGALLAAAFMDLLLEGAHEGNVEIALASALGGILIFFTLERAVHWFHHHRHNNSIDAKDARVPLIIISDTLHNAIDGAAIAAGFLVNPATGIIVTISVALHEIPQEIGDFGLLLAKGVKRSRVLLINIFSALATTLTAIIIFSLGRNVSIPLDAILGLTAGFFIYIAVSDIIPSVHNSESKADRFMSLQSYLMIFGAISIGLIIELTHRAM